MKRTLEQLRKPPRSVGKLRPCPLCGSRQVQIDGDRFTYYIGHCMNCASVEVEGQTEKQTRWFWNLLSRK